MPISLSLEQIFVQETRVIISVRVRTTWMIQILYAIVEMNIWELYVTP